MLVVVDTVHLVTSLLSFSLPTLSTSFLNTTYKYTLPFTLPIAQVFMHEIYKLGKLLTYYLNMSSRPFLHGQLDLLHVFSPFTIIRILFYFVPILDLDGDVCLHDHLPDSGEVHVHGPPSHLSPPQVYSLLLVPGCTWHGLLLHLHLA